MASDQQPTPPRLLDRVRAAIRVRHYSHRTEESYVGWIRRFILYHGKRHPSEMGAAEIAAFLSHLAVRRHVSGSTQNQALSAIVFLYRLRGAPRKRHYVQEGVTWSRERRTAIHGHLSAREFT